jgi:predicted PurR-regulated permease PerM
MWPPDPGHDLGSDPGNGLGQVLGPSRTLFLLCLLLFFFFFERDTFLNSVTALLGSLTAIKVTALSHFFSRR